MKQKTFTIKFHLYTLYNTYNTYVHTFFKQEVDIYEIACLGDVMFNGFFYYFYMFIIPIP